MKRLTAAAAFLLLSATATFAGPVADFESEMRTIYADYRAALFLTNMGNQEKAAGMIKKFQTEWSDFAKNHQAPPAQYEDDSQYPEALKQVGMIAGEAGDHAANGQLAESHEKLEAIREVIAGLHHRNGIIGFSDRMNAYHAHMETVLKADYGSFDADGLGRLREDAAILDYLAGQIAANPPAEAGAPEYKPLLETMLKATTALREAARAGDAAATKAARGTLKPAYSKFFLKFG